MYIIKLKFWEVYKLGNLSKHGLIYQEYQSKVSSNRLVYVTRIKEESRNSSSPELFAFFHGLQSFGAAKT
jgi:hypothetical protein